MVTIFTEDFETGGDKTAPNPNVSRTIIADPTPRADGMVAAADSSGGTQWGSFNSIPGNINLPAGVEPGISTFTATMKVFIPSTTTFTSNGGVDRVGMVLRWNAEQATNQSFWLDWDAYTPDTWETFEMTGTVPATDSTGSAITFVKPIFSFNDRDDDAAAGISAYVDDLHIEVSVSADDPNLSTTASLNFGDLDQNGGPINKPISIDNTGENESLTITAINLTGTNADLFALETVVFPLVINAGENATVDLTLDPGDYLGPISASVELVSDDASSPSINVNLMGNSVEPFEGMEFIVNGDFETGDLSGWRDDNRFDLTTDQSRSGGNAGIFTMLGGQEWGEARTSINEDPDQAIPITEEMIGKDYFYSAWYYRPSVGGPADDDTIQTIFRWNSSNTNNHTYGFNTIGNMPVDTWIRVTGSGVVPELGGDGQPTTRVTPLWSFRDVGINAAGTEFMYIDDVSFKIDVPNPATTPEITNIVHDADGNQVQITFTTDPGRTYTIQRNTGLDDAGWLELEDSLPAGDPLATFTDIGAPAGSPVYFYRVFLNPLPEN